ncbi:phosphoethanolamine--lipid A transferase [Paucibacter sp. APW11]|uniref:Phosphoethanolamine--lipid A transferase n=1 Tax=Roseateles aquae TaxID=3077235 RepID=A0ABU3P8D2_9BURK|nr:phosphoethanolamine--lipid A transferase [Paucibacter sp. APW11]MDT8998475.1 phosphoethanolamine--lipid A transferase [Paucibacter sp. APW11]
MRTPLVLAWLTALWIGTLANWPLWQQLLQLPELDNSAGRLFVLAFMGIVTALHGAVFSLVAWPWLLRPLMVFSLFSAAALAHFMGSYGIVVDPSMVVNIVQTDVREARDLLSLRLLVSLLILGLLPALWLYRSPVRRLGGWRQLALNAAGAVLGLGVVLALGMASFATLAPTMRDHKELRYMISPLNAYWSLGVVAYESQAQPDGPPAVVGADARLLPRSADAKPPLLLLVVGETARAANFSLNGYARPTNPRLQQETDLLSFRQVSSCGTSTAASLPCMFSHLGRNAFLDLKGSQENLLDVLQRAGLAVLWLDNQSGCKGLCDRVPNAQANQPAPAAAALPAGLCDAEECLDEALLHGLDQRLAALPAERRARGTVLVMHQMGSHGPAYYKRSPSGAKPFQPECRTNALQQCPREQVLNAYDNTIAYTDRILAGAIDWLKQQSGQHQVAMLYVSDHGESLGENNLFLHGMPYAVAPREQTHVPLLLWLPPATSAALRLQAGCLAQRIDQPFSHDQLFHTVLGLSGVATSLYRPDWDLLSPCKAH